MSARVGDRFGPYLLLHKIAQGGMGEVFLARKEGAEGFSRHVVVKRMLSHLADRTDFLEMFFAEARLASRLHHERIAQGHDAGRIGDEFYLEMEFVSGIDLKILLERCEQAGRPLPFAITCELIAQAAEGLAYAHRATDHDGQPLNLVHRDINPANLLLSWDGEVKIIDLGIAKSALHHGKTETGLLKGKFLYMSPEQSEGKAVDGSTDLFSLGIVLYETLLGRHPFDRGSLARTLAAIQSDELPPIVDPRLFPLEPIFDKVLAKAISDRYTDGDELARDLRQIVPAFEETQELTDFLAALFAEEQRYTEQILGLDDPTELKRLDRLTNPPVESLPTLPAGMDKPEGWTDFWREQPAAEVDPATVVEGVGKDVDARTTREPSSSTTSLFLQAALSESKRLWVLVSILALGVLVWGIWPRAAVPNSTDPATPPVETSIDSPEPIRSTDAGPARDSGPIPVQPAVTDKKDKIRPARPVQPVVTEPSYLELSSTSLTIQGLNRQNRARKQGVFTARAGEFEVRGKWRRTEGAMRISVQAKPWAIVYLKRGAALGRTPPERSLQIQAGQSDVLRFRHPKLGEFRIKIRHKNP